MRTLAIIFAKTSQSLVLNDCHISRLSQLRADTSGQTNMILDEIEFFLYLAEKPLVVVIGAQDVSC